MALRDIRHLMPQQDPNRFPNYEYQPYPRMMTYEDENGDKKPHLRGTQPVIVNSEEEEKAFLASLEKGNKKVEIPAPKAATIDDDLKPKVAAPVTGINKPRKLED